MARLLTLVVVLTVGMPAYATPVEVITHPLTVPIGDVGCLTNDSQGCAFSAVATTAQWIVRNDFGFSPAGGLGGGFAYDTNLLDVTLATTFAGGSRTWHWDIVHPLSRDAVTDAFDIAEARSVTNLALTATLSRTSWDPLRPFGNGLCCIDGRYYSEAFVADTATITYSRSTLIPVDFFSVSGTAIDTLHPLPEPSTWLLLASGLGVGGLCWWRQRARTEDSSLISGH